MVSRLVLVVIAMLSAGCAAGLHADPVSSSWFVSKTDPLAESRARAERARDLGLHEQATEAAYRHLEQARLAYALAELHDDEKARRSASRTLARAVTLAIAIGRSAEDPSLVALAAGWSPQPARHRRALERALRDGAWIDWRIATKPLVDVLEDDEARQLLNERRKDTPELEEADLAELGLRGRTALARRFEAAVDKGVGPDSDRLAGRLLALDPGHLPALLYRILRRDLERGLAVADVWLWTDLFTTWNRGPAISARNHLRHAAFPRSEGILLLRALTLWRADLTGDVAAILERDRAILGSEEARRASGILLALVDLASGNGEPYERIVAAHAPKALHMADEEAAALGYAVEEGPTTAALQPVWRRLADRDEETNRQSLARVFLDPGTPRKLRARAGAQLDRFTRIALSTCREREPHDRCLALSEELVDPDYDAVALLERWPDVIALGSRAFRGTHVGDFEGDTLAQLERSPLGETAEFQNVALRHEARRADAKAMRARLARVESIVDDTTAVWATLVLGELERGTTLSETAIDMWFELPRRTDGYAGVAAREEDLPRSLATLARGIRAWDDQDHAGAGAAWLELANASAAGSGPKAPYDRARIALLHAAALAAHLGDDTAAFDERRTSVATLAPHSPAARHLEALAATRTGGPAAIAALERAILDDPTAGDVYAALLEAVHANGVDDARILDFVVEWNPRASAPSTQLLDALGARKIATAKALLHALAIERYEAEATEHCDVARAVVPHRVKTAIDGLVQQALEAPDAAGARVVAARAVAFLENCQEPLAYRDVHARLLLLLGAHEAGLAVLDQSDPDQGIEPVEGMAPLRLLLEAERDRKLDETEAWVAFRWLGSGELAAPLVDRFTEGRAGDPLLPLACEWMATEKRIAEARTLCARAWAERRPHDFRTGVNLTYACLGEPSPDEACLRAVFEGQHAPAGFVPGSAGSIEHDAAYWLNNHAVWLRNKDVSATAIAMRVQAYAAGDDWDQTSPGFADFQRTGELLRQRELVLSNESAAYERRTRLAQQALLGGAYRAAEIYAREVSQWFPATRDNASTLYLADRIADASRLADDDRKADRIPEAELYEAIELLLTDGELERKEALQRRFPRSAVASLGLAEGYVAARRFDDASPLIEVLLRAYSDLPITVLAGIRVLHARGEDPRARELYAAIAPKHGARAILQYALLPETVVGPRAHVPDWIRTPEAYAARLAAVDDDAVARLVPEWRSHTEAAADGFFPITMKTFASEQRPLVFETEDDVILGVYTDDRASRCEGEACVQGLRNQFATSGVTVHWTRVTQTPDGEAIELMASHAERVSSVLVLPRGGRVFTLLAAAPPERFEELLPGVRLLREGFAPLDAVLPAFRAAVLRAAGRKLSDPERLASRREYGRRSPDDEDCPIPRTLAATQDEGQRAELLLDLMLLAGQPRDRKRLLACAGPESTAARRIALVALLDDDASIHAYGRAATLHHPSRVRGDVHEILKGPLAPPISAPDYFVREDLPPRGLIEVALALPAGHGRALVADLLESHDARDRGAAWIAALVRSDLLPDDHVIAAVRDGTAEDAAFAVDVLEERHHDDRFATMRERLDRIGKVTDPATAWLSVELASGIASAVEDGDRKRLTAIVKRIAVDDPGLRKQITERLESIAESHASALALAANEDRGKGDALALELVSEQRIADDAEPRPAADLARLSLAELLPGNDWMYARVASPGLFASTVLSLSRRVSPGEVTERFMIRSMIDRMMESSGFPALLESGGLDLGRPIECASRAPSRPFVCVATVKDRDAVLTGLSRRGFGSDTGLALPLKITGTFAVVPMLISAVPALLHQVVYDEAEEGPEPRSDNPVVQTERLRRHMPFPDYDVEYYAIVQQREHDADIDAERYLFIGDRLFVFATGSMARQVLFPASADTKPLAEAPAFARLTAPWRDGSALQAVALGRAALIPDAEVSMEVVVDGEGISFRYTATTDTELADVRRAAVLLPEGASAELALGIGTGENALFTDFLGEPRKLAGADVLVPTVLVDRSEGAAFGWYARPGDSVWQRWLLVMPRSPRLDAAAHELGMRPGTTVARAKDGLHATVHEDHWIVGSDPMLVEQARARTLPSTPSPPTLLTARGSMSGAKVAPIVTDLPITADLQPGVLRFMGGAFRLVDDVTFEATWDPGSRLGVLEGHVRLHLTAPGDEGEVVDQWLAATRRNASHLPRTLQKDEVEGRLAYVIRVSDPARFATHSVRVSPRARVERVDGEHVRLIVDAVPDPSSPAVPLGDAERKRLLETSDTLRSSDPKIVSTSRSIAPPGTPPGETAQKILTWVHGRLTYEVTPRTLDGVAILELGRGDCSEYAQLTVSLLRAAGIPAEVRSGMAASGNELVAHAWVAYHDGERWHEIDPTWGRASVTAGHLPIEVVDVLALLSLDRFAIERIEVSKPAPGISLPEDFKFERKAPSSSED